MCKQSCVVAASAVIALALGAVPARAQSLLQGSPDTVWYGNVRLEGAPAEMYPHDGGSDNTGAVFRLGYGLTSRFNLEAKSGFFDGVTLLGGDAHVRLYDRKDTVAAVTVGGHHAFVSDALDSNALDLAATAGHWFSPRLQVYAGFAYSFEKLNGVPRGLDDTFSRWYLVPGLRVGVSKRVDVLVEGGVGLDDNAPYYVTAGVAFNLPVTDRAAGRR